jgi:hypothetical protein
MILDEHTPCPACPQVVRDLYVVGRRLVAGGYGTLSLTELEELYHVLEAFRPFIEAHHANQLHSHAMTLEDARHPQVPQVARVVNLDPGDSQR